MLFVGLLFTSCNSEEEVQRGNEDGRDISFSMTLTGVDGKFGKVDGVGTHVGYQSGFVQTLRHHHGLCHGEATVSYKHLYGECQDRRYPTGKKAVRPHLETYHRLADGRRCV